jgi:hypothetical protein
MEMKEIIGIIVGAVGGTAVIVTGIAWIAKLAINHLFSRKLEESKIRLSAEYDAALSRIKRLEESILTNRTVGYDQVWKLTGSLNLFGPTTKIDIKELSTNLKDWYFEHGWVLSGSSKNKYFIVQEIINFIMLRDISIRRPADEYLFGDPDTRPVDQLHKRRKNLLNIDIRTDHESYDFSELESFVSNWKAHFGGRDKEEKAWLVLQLALSAFRSGVVDEIGSREAYYK